MKLKKIVTLMMVMLCVGAVALAEITVQTVADPTYVRSTPEIAENIIDSLKSDREYEWGGNIEIDERGVAWLDIYYSSNKYGWVSSLHCNLIQENGKVIHFVTDDVPDTQILALEEVEVYSGPGTNNIYLGVIYAGDVAEFTGFRKKDAKGIEWYQIISAYGNGWVSSEHTMIF